MDGTIGISIKTYGSIPQEDILELFDQQISSIKAFRRPNTTIHNYDKNMKHVIVFIELSLEMP